MPDDIEAPSKHGAEDDLFQCAMEALFKEAEQRGLWLWHRYHGLWFSPYRLRQEQSNGKFRRHPEEWELRLPLERLIQAKNAVRTAEEHLLQVQREQDEWELEVEKRRASHAPAAS